MGWSSGSVYIETVHNIIFPLEETGVSEDVAYRLLYSMWDLLKEGDWDVEDEFMEAVDRFHGGDLPDVLKKFFGEKGYTRIKDRSSGWISWVTTDSLEYYNLKEFELA